MYYLSSLDIQNYYKPSRCERRVYLMAHPTRNTQKNGENEQENRDADEQHERRHLKTLGPCLNLSRGEIEDRAEATRQAIKNKVAIMYKPVLAWDMMLDGVRCRLYGFPDFLLKTEQGFILRQCKMAKKINRDNHPDTLQNLQFHGWLLEQILGPQAELQLEVFNSQGKLLAYSLAEPEEIIGRLKYLLKLKQAESEPYSPISWTKCQSCSFKKYCWSQAEEEEDIALLPNLEKHLILALRDTGILTVSQLLNQMPLEKLAHFRWEEGEVLQELGEEKAQLMLHMARSLLESTPILLQVPQLPQSDYWVMFDVEGIPAQQGYPERIYLWGIYLMGKERRNLQILAPQLNQHLDEKNWLKFLAQAGELFATYGDIPFVHWGSFEPNCLRMYLQRYGDSQGIAKRIGQNLLDFFQLLKDSIIIPLPSYSLKVIEQYVGFDRPDKDYGGYWSVVNYLKSTHTKDKARRRKIQQQLLDYNQADLEAMWHVVEWFQAFLAERIA